MNRLGTSGKLTDASTILITALSLSGARRATFTCLVTALRLRIHLNAPETPGFSSYLRAGKVDSTTHVDLTLSVPTLTGQKCFALGQIFAAFDRTSSAGLL